MQETTLQAPRSEKKGEELCSDRAGTSLHPVGGVMVEQVFPCSPWRTMPEQLGVQTLAMEKPVLQWADVAFRNCSQCRAHMGLQPMRRAHVGAAYGEPMLDQWKSFRRKD